MKIFYNVFSRLCRFYSFFGEKDIQHFYSMSIITMFLYFNFSTFVSLIEYNYYPNSYTSISTVFGICLYVINYFIFIYKDRYKELLSKYGPSNKRIVNMFLNTIIVIYMLASIISWIYAGSLVRSLNI